MSANIYLILFGTSLVSVGIISFLLMLSSFKKENSKKIRLDIELKNMQKIENDLAQFYAENNITTTLNIQEIATILKVHDGGETSEIDEQAKLSEPDENGNMYVTFKKGLNQHEKLFSFAHECAHIINKDPLPGTRPEGFNKPYIEQLADYTAAAILLPLEDVYKVLLDKQYTELSTNQKLKVVRFICKRYRVSEIIALRRIEEVYKLKDI